MSLDTTMDTEMSDTKENNVQEMDSFEEVPSDSCQPSPDNELRENENGIVGKPSTALEQQPEVSDKMENDVLSDKIENNVQEVDSFGKTPPVSLELGSEIKRRVNGNGIYGKPSTALKQQPEVLCNCPLHCNKKIAIEKRMNLYQQFRDLVDHPTQNKFIMRHIKIRDTPKQLFSDEIVDKKIQRRVTCKYLIPVRGSVADSLFFAKKLSYESAKFYLDSYSAENPKELLNKSKNNYLTDDLREIQTDFLSTLNSLPKSLPAEWNGHHDSVSELQKTEICDVNSPMSFNDSDSVSTSLDGTFGSENENISPKSVKYIEVCQKAFMNMFGLTEKRIRWQRERLLQRSRIIAAEKKKEMDEIERTLSLARSLGAGCQPLFALLEKRNCLDQLLSAIKDDVDMVNNFFHNQLWNPEDMMNKSLNVSSLELDSMETECD